jgi:predicted pyridoxine 5'-phosphate oxidase superfamily flavin-nucleotide-binding protein
MVKLTEEIKADLKKVRILPLSTSTTYGEPNVVPMGMFVLQEEGNSIWFIDNFMQKTLRNLKSNPVASFYIWSPETSGAWQVKGTVKVETSGADYEKAKAIANSMRAGSPAKSLIKMKITRVYSVKPGPTAGKKVL